MKIKDFPKDGLEYVLGFFAIVAFYVWQYDSLSPGWRFFGMVAISLVVGIAVQLFFVAVDSWRSVNIEKSRSAAMCREIAVSESSTVPEDVAKCWRYMIHRYSNELLVNRLSNMVGTLVTILNSTISIGLSLWYFGMIVYFVWGGDYSNPLILWIPLFFRLISLGCAYFIGFSCNVLFNRYPGEAKMFNKNYDAIRNTDVLLSSKEFRESVRN